MKQTIKNNSKITWKLYKVSITAPDGVLLNGEIHYWAKDYSICMTKPFKEKACNGHLMYSVPAVYATDEVDRKGVYHYRLIELAQKKLLSIYRGEVEKC